MLDQEITLIALQEKIEEIKRQYEIDKDVLDLDQIYLKYFSKTNGIISELTKILPTLSLENKKVFGSLINDLKREIEDKIKNINYEAVTKLDESIKIERAGQGHLHPTTIVTRELNNFFKYHGYSVYSGPEIETEEFNFRKLNLPENHPATDLQDSIYIREGLLLRTHTSSVETRLLTEHKPPIRAVIAGKAYRNEARTATNSSFFYQYQGVVVDQGITVKNLVYSLIELAKHIIGEDVTVRIRYKYYPEVSPGLTIDTQCKFCGGDGCSICKYRGYVEIGGSGMIHFNTLKMCGIDPDKYTGFAFGMGLDRLAMQKFKISDLRKLYGGVLTYQ